MRPVKTDRTEPLQSLCDGDRSQSKSLCHDGEKASQLIHPCHSRIVIIIFFHNQFLIHSIPEDLSVFFIFLAPMEIKFKSYILKLYRELISMLECHELVKFHNDAI
jgi:hypothetical protein